MGISGRRTRWRLVETQAWRKSERLLVLKPDGLGNKAVDKLQDAVGTIGKTFEKLFAVDAFTRFALIEPGFRAGSILRWRHPDEREVIKAFEMGAFFLELGAALIIDKRGDSVRKFAPRIGLGGDPARLDKDGPAAS